MLAEQATTYEFVEGEATFAAWTPAFERIVREFADWLETPYRFRSGPLTQTCSSGNSAGRVCNVETTIAVRRGSVLEKLTCTLNNAGSSCLTFTTIPPSRSGVIGLPGSFLSQPELSRETVDADQSVFHEPVQGVWSINARCVVDHGREARYTCQLDVRP
jgi:hypothetical protein